MERENSQGSLDRVESFQPYSYPVYCLAKVLESAMSGDESANKTFELGLAGAHTGGDGRGKSYVECHRAGCNFRTTIVQGVPDGGYDCPADSLPVVFIEPK